MRRLFYTILPLLFAAVFCMQAQSTTPLTFKKGFPRLHDFRTEEFRGFGYGNRYVMPEDIAAVGMNQAGTNLALAIQLPKMNGNKVKGVHFYSLDQPANGQIFMADGNGKILAVKDVNITKGWNAHSFATPVEIKSDAKCFVGFRLTSSNQESGKFPLAFDSEKEYALSSFIAILKAGDKCSEGATISFEDIAGYGFGNPLLFVDIDDTAVSLAQAVLMYSSKLSPNQLAPGSKSSLLLTLRNVGFDAVNKGEVLCRFMGEGGEKKLSFGAIAPGKTIDFKEQLEMPNAPIGNYSLSVTIPTVNDKANFYADNLSKISYSFADAGMIRKSILLERFTTERCGFCPPSNPNVNRFIKFMEEDGVEVSVIAHHAGYYTDFLTVPESEKLLPYMFSNKGTYAPALTVNRMVCDEQENTLVYSASGVLNPLYDAAMKQAELIKLTSVKPQINGNKLSLNIKGKTQGALDETDIYLTAVITETDIPAKNQSGGGANYLHHSVARKFLTDAFGQKIQLKDDKTFELDLKDKEFKSEWKTEKMRVVLFLHRNLENKEKTDRSVFSSATLYWNSELGLTEAYAPEEPIVVVENGYLAIIGVADSVEVYNMSGVLVANNITTPLAQGMYLVKVKNYSGTFVSKIVVR